MFQQDAGRLIYSHDGETLWVDAWGPDAFRVRATKNFAMPTASWALDEAPPKCVVQLDLGQDSESTIQNGKMKCIISSRGKISFYNETGVLLLQEYARNRRDILDEKCSATEIEAREFKARGGSNYHLTSRFESLDPTEKIFGMGQYQHCSRKASNYILISTV